MSDLLQAALAYARRGIPVFPCEMLEPDQNGKTKYPLTPQGFKDATTDEAQITEWWTKWPNAGIGMATGAAGFLVVDIDSYNGGDDSLKMLENGHGPITAPRIATGGGGWHLYFRGDERFSQGAGHVKGIDFRGTTGYVIVPPSPHTSGRAYVGEVPDPSSVPPIPDWLADALLTKKVEAADVDDLKIVELTQKMLDQIPPKTAAQLKKARAINQDDSKVEYQVACALAGTGWDGNQIYTLLQQWPIREIGDPKRGRMDYYRKTIGKALNSEVAIAIRNAPKPKKTVVEAKPEIGHQHAGDPCSECGATTSKRVIPMYRADELIETYKNTKLPWVSQGLLLRGEVTLVVGSAKIGKSTLLLQLLQRITTGGAWAFSKKEIRVQHPAIYYSLEMGEVPLAKRMDQLFGKVRPRNLWVVPVRDYTIDWDEIGEKVDATEASVVVIDNLLGTNIGDINKQEIAGKVMNEAFAFAQEKNVAVVIVHHTRKGARTDLTKQQQEGDPLDEAHGSKVFANKAGILIFLRKTTGSRGRNTYCEINIVSRFGESKTIKATFDRAQKGKWRRRSQEDQTDEDEDSELEGEEDEETSENQTLAQDSGAKVVSGDLTHTTPKNSEDLSTVTDVVSTKVPTNTRDADEDWTADREPNPKIAAAKAREARRSSELERIVDDARKPRKAADIPPLSKSDITGIENMVRSLRKGEPNNGAPLWHVIADLIKEGLSDTQIIRRLVPQ